MRTNAVPVFDKTDNETGCCPRFHPEPWENQTLHFENKPFVRASTIGVFHIPLNMGRVFSRTWQAIEAAHADDGGFLVLSDDATWHADHLFAVSHPVPGADMVYLSGDFRTRVFEGPYGNAPAWQAAMARDAEEQGKTLQKTYFFYTSCPRCAKHYGRNYVVGVARVT